MFKPPPRLGSPSPISSYPVAIKYWLSLINYQLDVNNYINNTEKSIPNKTTFHFIVKLKRKKYYHSIRTSTITSSSSSFFFFFFFFFWTFNLDHFVLWTKYMKLRGFLQPWTNYLNAIHNNLIILIQQVLTNSTEIQKEIIWNNKYVTSNNYVINIKDWQENNIGKTQLYNWLVR